MTDSRNAMNPLFRAAEGHWPAEAGLRGRDDEPEDALLLLLEGAGDSPPIGRDELADALRRSARVFPENPLVFHRLLYALVVSGKALRRRCDAAETIRPYLLEPTRLRHTQPHPSTEAVLKRLGRAWIEVAPLGDLLPPLLGLPLRAESRAELALVALRRRRPEDFPTEMSLWGSVADDEVVEGSIRAWLMEAEGHERARRLRQYLCEGDFREARFQGLVAQALASTGGYEWPVGENVLPFGARKAA